MPFVKTSRRCARCGKQPGMLYGIEGEGASPSLCGPCFNGGRGVLDTLAKLFLKRPQ